MARGDGGGIVVAAVREHDAVPRSRIHSRASTTSSRYAQIAFDYHLVSSSLRSSNLFMLDSAHSLILSWPDRDAMAMALACGFFLGWSHPTPCQECSSGAPTGAQTRGRFDLTIKTAGYATTGKRLRRPWLYASFVRSMIAIGIANANKGAIMSMDVLACALGSGFLCRGSLVRTNNEALLPAAAARRRNRFSLGGRRRSALEPAEIEKTDAEKALSRSQALEA